MNVKTGLAALAIGCAAAFAIPQSAQAAPYVYGGYYDGYYAPRHPVRYCYDEYGYRYYCGPTYGYYRPYYPSYYGPSVSIGFGYGGRGYNGWGHHGWDHGHGGNWNGGHDGHHWHR